MTARRRGRPRGPSAAAVLTRTLAIRLTADEYAALEARCAADTGIRRPSPGEYAREVIRRALRPDGVTPPG